MKSGILSLMLLCLIIFSGLTGSCFAQERTEVPFNSDWSFSGTSVNGGKINEKVNLPHTWNASDAQSGIPYFRGKGVYEKHFAADPLWKGKRVFIRFEGVMTTASVTINSKPLGEHKGGYSAFCYELTPFLDFTNENILRVEADNKFTKEILPLVGDFNIYGGIYRPVNLIITSLVCISPLDYASSGVYLKQKNVSKDSASIEVVTRLSNTTGKSYPATIESTLFDASGKIILSINKDLKLSEGDTTVSQIIGVAQPHLWNGRKDPYLYHVQVNISQYGRVADSKTEPLGIRFFNVDPNLGFFLNGEHLALHGVARHQDRLDKGNALLYDDHKQDMQLMLEMGINALRLAHYQHSKVMYDLCDSSGVVVWAEMPWVGGPAGFMGSSNGYENTDAFHSNAKQQLTELIRQNFNHPSIFMWSIFNEIQNPKNASPVDFIKELNSLAKSEDPSRITTGASMMDPKEPIHNITDLIAFNRYFGWYYKDPAAMGKFLDKVHGNYPALNIGISEYGAGGAVSQHSSDLSKPNPFGSPHPEEYESYYHEQNLKIFNNRPFVWGTFAWNMFDFGSQFRREGDHNGINDKGLVTFDRKIKKDAFYFYKANWSNEDVLYITSRRFLIRHEKTTAVKVYSNLDSVTLFVNDSKIGTKAPSDCITEWKGVELKEGNNQVLVQGMKNGVALEDRCVWQLETKFGLQQLAKILDMMKYLPYLLIIGLVFMFYFWYNGYWKRRSRSVRITSKIFLVLFIIIELLMIIAKIVVGSLLG